MNFGLDLAMRSPITTSTGMSHAKLGVLLMATFEPQDMTEIEKIGTQR